MATTLYCWRCKRDVPMLDEREWAVLEPLLADRISRIQAFRQNTGATLKEAVAQDFGREVLLRHHAMTGVEVTDPDALWHHRAIRLGPPCEACAKPLRTPRAAFCAACGWRPGKSAADTDH